MADKKKRLYVSLTLIKVPLSTGERNKAKINIETHKLTLTNTHTQYTHQQWHIEDNNNDIV